jgi:transcriptional regulator with XRE-family HTH domain
METEQDLGLRLGAAIREARKARQWTQATLAEKLDVSVTYVGMVERGENLTSLPLLIQLARLFGASVASLIGEPSAEPWVDETIALMRALPPSGRDMVLGMLRGAAATSGSSTERPKVERSAARRKGRR